MTEHRSFWSRLISRFRRSHGRQQCSEYSDESIGAFPFNDNFQFCDRASFETSRPYGLFRFKESEAHSKSDSYIPKSLGNIDASSILFGRVRPESLSRGCWLENHLNRFGDTGVSGDFHNHIHSYDLEDTFSVQSETDSDFVFRQNYDNSDSDSANDIRFYDADSLDGFPEQISELELAEFGDSDSDYSVRIDRILHYNMIRAGECSDDDATLRGSTQSLESTVSEVLGMLDEVLEGQCGRTPSPVRSLPSILNRPLPPPPYSAVNTEPTPPMAPLEPPPSYSDLFGHEQNHVTDIRCL